MPDGPSALSRLVERIPAAIWEADIDAHRMVYVSPRVRDLYGHEPDAWLAVPGFWEQHVHPDDLAQAAMAVAEAIAADASDLRIEYRFHCADGRYVWIRDVLSIGRGPDGGRRLSGVMSDVTGEREAQLAALAGGPEAPVAPASGPSVLAGLGEGGLFGPGGGLAAGLHQAVVDNLADGLYLVDTERRIRYWNRAAERLTGYAAADVIGRRCLDDILVHVDAAGRSLCGSCPLSTALSHGSERQEVTWLRRVDGQRIPVLVRASPVRLPGSSGVRGVVESFTDMSGLALPGDPLPAAAGDPFLDTVTGLPDRRLLDAVLRARKDDLDRYRLPFGLLLLELDGHGALVAAHGPLLGDLALRVVARTVQSAVRNGDTLVRWGPAEFALALAMADADALQVVGERIRRLVHATGLPMRGRPAMELRVSLGGTLARAGEPLSGMFVRAQRALATARRGGHDRMVLLGSSRDAGDAGNRMLGIRG